MTESAAGTGALTMTGPEEPELSEAALEMVAEAKVATIDGFCDEDFILSVGRGTTNICGQEAFVHATHPDVDKPRRRLCAHHGRALRAKLEAAGYTIYTTPVTCCIMQDCGGKIH